MDPGDGGKERERRRDEGMTTKGRDGGGQAGRQTGGK